jgi:hypothetical protein
MIRFSKNFPLYKYPFGFLKQLSGYYQYFDHPVIDTKNPVMGSFLGINGKQSFLSSLRDKHKGQRCFIIANGPSLNDLNIDYLKDEITLGCNGIFNRFNEWGFHTNYYFIEDNVQTELRVKEVSKLKGPIKFIGLHNNYCFPFFNDLNYFHVPIRGNMDYTSSEDLYPQFSLDVAAITYFGGTITYIMLQFAYHLGFDEVYIVGLDHDYGKLPEIFPPGKIKVTKENYAMVQQCHYDKNYYQIGDTLGVPHVEAQNSAYEKANKIFNQSGRKVFNASSNTKLEVFEKVKYENLF